MPSTTQEMLEPYGPEGNPVSARYVFVAEAPAKEEIRLGRPLVGPSGKLFDASLQQAGILRQDCYITNVFNFQIGKTKDNTIVEPEHKEPLWTPRGGYTPAGTLSRDRLVSELAETNANVIVCLGAVSTTALLGQHRAAITKVRGSIYEAAPQAIAGRKVIPTFHPAAILHGQFNWRYMLDWDIKRAKRESAYSHIRENVHNFKLLPTTREALAFLNELDTSCPELISIDIEIQNKQVICVGFGLDEQTAYCVDFYDRTIEQEKDLWLAIAKVLGNPKIGKLFQNGMFDIGFLLTQCDIVVRGKIHDTMVAHHIMYPDLPKGMAFMQSIYTDEPYHKDMVKHGEVGNVEG